MLLCRDDISAVESYHRVTTEVDCAVVALAMERYRLAHDAWPASLDQLVPHYLDKVPENLYVGGPLHYRKLADGVVIYAFGENETDEGGTLTPDPNAPHYLGQTNYPPDYGFRLWNPDKRGQAPPEPGSPIWLRRIWNND